MVKPKKSKQVKMTLADKVIDWPLLALVIISFLGFMVYRQIQQHAQKQVFSELELSLLDFSAKVEQAIGSPAQKETKSFCNREGEKFKTGKLYCGTRTGMNYGANLSENAKTQAEIINTLINQHEMFVENTPGRQTERPSDWYKSGILKTKHKNIECKIDMSYQDTTRYDTSNYIGESKPGYFSWLIRCTDFASRAYYPEGY